MNKEFLEQFDWSKYDKDYKGGNHLIPNENIKGQDKKTKCFSREHYAQELFDILNSSDSKIIKKDLVKGDCVSIVNIHNIRDDKATIELLGGLTVDIDLSREKKFIQLFGYNTIDEFIVMIQQKEYLEKFIEQGLLAFVIESSPTLKISLWQGHLKKVREEFMKEIETPSKAYVAKILEANKGGYFVEVQGMEAFMPGSLAAPNKIVDFYSLVGKEVIVMIEDFLAEISSFIVSHKKYIEYILPTKLSELSLEKEYEGSVTGCSKYGIFIEFADIFTGLLHNSKMKNETLNKFKNFEYKPGDKMKFFISEISKDNRIILTEESPIEKKEKISKFVEENKDKVIEGEVAAVMDFGIIVNVGGGLAGLIPNKEFKIRKISTRNFIIGDKLKIRILDVKDDKLVFRLESERRKEEEGVV